jgi:hypothetical protein
METQGVPAHIQVTEATYVRLREQYVFEERGDVEVKGKGAMRAYLLAGRRAAGDKPAFRGRFFA